MLFIPAIDVLGGKVVRLRKGAYDDVTVYAKDPLEPAQRFVDAGCEWLHVVDLDGARDGHPGNLPVLEALAALPLRVQVGGGIRTESTARQLWSAGATRLVLGTAALRDPAFAKALAKEGEVVIAADARGGRVAIAGWQETSDTEVAALVRRAEQWGAKAVLYTNIERDGMKSGPDVTGTAELQKTTTLDVIASGGISSLDDLEALRDAGVRACVAGRALLDGVFTVEDATSIARTST